MDEGGKLIQYDGMGRIGRALDVGGIMAHRLHEDIQNSLAAAQNVRDARHGVLKVKAGISIEFQGDLGAYLKAATTLDPPQTV